jgi:hypothetical protein
VVLAARGMGSEIGWWVGMGQLLVELTLLLLEPQPQQCEDKLWQLLEAVSCCNVVEEHSRGAEECQLDNRSMVDDHRRSGRESEVEMGEGGLEERHFQELERE